MSKGIALVILLLSSWRWVDGAWKGLLDAFGTSLSEILGRDGVWGS
jgi:hypothetical protein